MPVRVTAVTRLRLALAGAAVVAAASVPFAAPAQAMACHPDFQFVCTTIGLVCHTVDDLPKAECPRLG